MHVVRAREFFGPRAGVSWVPELVDDSDQRYLVVAHIEG